MPINKHTAVHVVSLCAGMATVQIATLFCLTLLYSTQACDIGKTPLLAIAVLPHSVHVCVCAVGSNIDLSATCYNNGSVVYAWQYVSEAHLLGNAEISYTCTTQQGNTVSTPPRTIPYSECTTIL